MSHHFNKKELEVQYLGKKRSVAEIARKYNCSQNKINYWLKKFDIDKRSIGDAIYIKKNPSGDPFLYRTPNNIEEAILYGIGVGLYWGEGNKANMNTVRLGNTDPILLSYFIEFLKKFFNIKQSDLRFHLQLFSDTDVQQAIRYWKRTLKFKDNQLYKPTITPSRKKGTYRQKSLFGVLTVYYSNVKLRNKIISLLPL
jgi:hypothetical protein